MQIEKRLLTLNQDIAGQEIGIPVYTIKSGVKNAPKVYIQSAVHAAEMQGSAVIYQLIQLFKDLELKADFTLVPNCNPFGRTQRAGEYLQGRFDATTGNNWNRFYYYDEGLFQGIVDSYSMDKLAEKIKTQPQDFVKECKEHIKSRLAQQVSKEWGINTAQFLNNKLQQLATDADYVLDLHTGPSSTRHIYAPEFLANEAQKFNIETIISIPTKFAGALDEASFTPWVDLAENLAKRDIRFDYRVKAFTVELGSQENICLQQALADASGILNYMRDQGLVKGQSPHEPEPAKIDIATVGLSGYRTLFSKYAGMVEYIAKAGDHVVEGEPIAKVLNSLEFDSDQAIQTICAPASGVVILHYPSAAVQVGTQLYKIAVFDNKN